jgi:uncharacterized protein YdeI (YjbR/CyaY-like superfamily)
MSINILGKGYVSSGLVANWEVECNLISSGPWTLELDEHEDWYTWTEGFKATHEELGIVEGDFEGNIYIYPNDDTDEALVESFNETFSCTLNEFDKGDI